jgi:thioredoxin 1
MPSITGGAILPLVGLITSLNFDLTDKGVGGLVRAVVIMQRDKGIRTTDEIGREPRRDEIDRMEGPILLEFGASWCGHCLNLAPKLSRLLEDYPKVRHIKVEDGRGKPLGRSFRVKLWPTLVFMRDGRVVRQISRPDVGEVREGLAEIAGP